MGYLRKLWPLAALLVLACGPQGPEKAPEKEPEVPVDETVAVTSVSLSQTSISLEEGQTQSLTATVFPPNATDPTVTWKSSDEAVARVEGGVVTGVKKGSARITASAGAKSAVCKVTVTEIIYHVTSVTIEPASASLTQEEQVVLTASVLPENAINRNISWTIEGDASVASIAADGFSATLTALQPGKVSVVATSEDGAVRGSCEVTVLKKIIHVESVAIEPATLALTEEETATLIATVLPLEADDRSISWTVADPSVASVSGEGLSVTLTAMMGGRTTVTATSTDGSISATCQVSVTALARDADFVQKVFYVWPGCSFTPEARYSDNRPATPTDWAVAEGNFLEVNSSGEVSISGFSANPGRITAKVGEGVLSLTVWSDLSLKAGSGEGQPADGGVFSLDIENSPELTLSILYRSSATDWTAVPEQALGTPASKDEGIASVSRTGASYRILAKGSGSTEISLPVGPATITVSINVSGSIPSDGTITYPEDKYGTL